MKRSVWRQRQVEVRDVAGSVINVSARPSRSTRRSCRGTIADNSVPSGAKVRPHATPRSLARPPARRHSPLVDRLEAAETLAALRTTPPRRVHDAGRERLRRPVGPHAKNRDRTSRLRVPPGHIQVAVMVEHRVSTGCRPVAHEPAPTPSPVSPGTSSIRTVARPLSPSGGTITARRVGDA